MFEDDFEEEDEGHVDDWFDQFSAEGLITDVILPLKSGKEASVYLCRATPKTGAALLAAKVYRPRTGRTFKNDAVYKEGRVILDKRVRRAMHNKSRFGVEADEGWWIAQENDVLNLLHRLGADVPRPVASCSTAILMEYLGDEDGSAPQLRDVDLFPADARTLFDRLMRNVELFLANNLVHADLSAYNVLVWGDEMRIIDFPQAVDARTNRNARDLLSRDLENVCRHFSRYGVRADPGAIAGRLWSDFLFARL